MIVPKSPQLIRMVRYVGRPLLLLFLWDVLVVLAFQLLHFDWGAASAVPLALYGSAIGIILGFRNNLAYARWWEARTLWGQIVNNSRSLARQVCASLVRSPGEEDLRKKILHQQIAFAHALRQQLRGLDPLAEIKDLLEKEEWIRLAQETNVSLAIQASMGSLLRDALRRGCITDWEWQSMDRNLDDLADAQGGTERIKSTPMPKQYNFFPSLFVHTFCVLLPLGMVANLGWFTPLGSTLVGFMFLVLDKIGNDLEEPFDNNIFDVPMTAITRNIEINLRQMLGERDLPPQVVPVKGVLW